MLNNWERDAIRELVTDGPLGQVLDASDRLAEFTERLPADLDEPYDMTPYGH